jgi:predicted transcriptional regulator
MIKTKVYVLFYVDPDEKDKNNLFSDMLKVKQYDQKHFGSIAVINMAASWLPNIILERALKEKQEKYPRTLYVKDKKKVLVNAWQLEDDASVVLVFDRKGRVIYHTAEQIEQKEGEMILELIEERLARSPLSCN